MKVDHGEQSELVLPCATYRPACSLDNLETTLPEASRVAGMHRQRVRPADMTLGHVDGQPGKVVHLNAVLHCLKI